MTQHWGVVPLPFLTGFVHDIGLFCDAVKTEVLSYVENVVEMLQQCPAL